MSRSIPTLDPKVRALLDQERSVPPLPAGVRARALVRARAALDAGGMTPSGSSVPSGRIRWVAAAAAMCVVSAAVGAAAYAISAHWASRPQASAPTTATVAASPVQSSIGSTSNTPTPAPEAMTAERTPPSTSNGAIAGPTPSQADLAQAELRLLSQARAAVARGDFAAALPPIAEHARRFSNGRLAEEREALRIKALSGLGRASEARRAASAFQARFPQSVLLPAVTQMPDSGR